MDVNKFEKFLRNKPGPAHVGAKSKAQYDSNTIFPQLETTKPLKKLKIDEKTSSSLTKPK